MGAKQLVMAVAVDVAGCAGSGAKASASREAKSLPLGNEGQSLGRAQVDEEIAGGVGRIVRRADGHVSTAVAVDIASRHRGLGKLGPGAVALHLPGRIGADPTGRASVDQRLAARGRIGAVGYADDHVVEIVAVDVAGHGDVALRGNQGGPDGRRRRACRRSQIDLVQTSIAK